MTKTALFVITIVLSTSMVSSQITIVFCPYIVHTYVLCTFYFKGFFVPDPELLALNGPNVKKVNDLASFIEEQSGKEHKTVNQRIKSNEENDHVNLESVIKMFEKVKKKLANCQKLKDHTHLITDHSQEVTFVKPSFARNLALHGMGKSTTAITNLGKYISMKYKLHPPGSLMEHLNV